MIVGLGTDIVERRRIQASLDRLGNKFAERILTTDELGEFLASKQAGALLAKRFAAKEAAVKALGLGIGNGISWQQVSISHNDLGAPLLGFTGFAKEHCEKLGVKHVHLSISDEQHYAVATVILES